MKVWFQDGSPTRLRKSLEASQVEGFEPSISREVADIIAIHEGDVRTQTGYSIDYPNQLIFIYSSGSLNELSNTDRDSMRVLHLIWKIPPSSYIQNSDWKKIKDFIALGAEGKKRWKHHSLSKVMDYISSLLILCQGYLYAYGGKTLGELYPLDQNARNLIARVTTEENQSKVALKSFWTENFSERSEEIKKKIAYELGGEILEEKLFLDLLEAIQSETPQDKSTLAIEVCRLIYQRLK